MYYFIINPISGRGRGKKLWKTLKARLDREAVSYQSFVLRHPGEAKKLAAGLSETARPFTLVVVGGDGTLNEVVNGLSSFENVTLACIPTGSGNDFVRGLGLPTDPLKALNAVFHPSVFRQIKIGAVTARSLTGSDASGTANPSDAKFDPTSGSFAVKSEQPSCSFTAKPDQPSCSFAVSSGIGFDAAVCHGANQSVLKTVFGWFHAGKIVYLVTALRQLFSMRLQPLRIQLDDKPEQTFPNAFFAAAMNLAYEGGGFMFAPSAEPEGDHFYICLASDVPVLRVLTLLPLALFGRHEGKKGIHLLPCRQATITAAAPLYVHTDGEILGFYDQITISARPGRLRVICG